MAAAVGATAIAVVVLGKGSNLLVADAGFHGLCVRLGDGFARIEIEADLVRAGGAAAYPVLARRTAAAGLTGLEWAVGIPGSVGGAVAMNAGGHGAQTSDLLVDCRVVSLQAGAEHLVAPKALDLSYRHSSIGPYDVVTEASYRLEPGDAALATARIDEVVRWRREHQPGGQNAGSVFTNPPDAAAGATESPDLAAAGLWMRLRNSQDLGSGRPEEVVAAIADQLGMALLGPIGSGTAEPDRPAGREPVLPAEIEADRPALEIVRPVRERLWLSDELAL